MEELEKYFNNLLPGGKVHYPGGKVICLKQVPPNALELYMSKFKYLTLKDEAVEYLQKLCENDLEFLLDLKKGTYDAKIIRKALSLKKKSSKKS